MPGTGTAAVSFENPFENSYGLNTGFLNLSNKFHGKYAPIQRYQSGIPAPKTEDRRKRVKTKNNVNNKHNI